MLKTILATIVLFSVCATTSAQGAAFNRALPVLNAEKDANASALLINKSAVLTAAHAVSGSVQVFACGPGLVKGRLVRFDLLYDLAIFELATPCEKVDVTPLAKASAVEGEMVTIQGYPGTNTRRTVVGAVVSYEILPGPPVPRLYMLTDAVISGGNSGGPVLNAKGELVGIVQGRLCHNSGHEGISSACYGTTIPVASIRKFLEGLGV